MTLRRFRGSGVKAQAPQRGNFRIRGHGDCVELWSLDPVGCRIGDV